MPIVSFSNIGTIWALENPSGTLGALETSVDGRTIRLRCAPNTDWWRVPPKGGDDVDGRDASSGPSLVLKLRSPASENGFRAEVGFRGAWKHRYDQAGLILYQRVRGALPEDALSKPRWIKTGIEAQYSQRTQNGTLYTKL
jgi:regulation of enolase protein 1 (concanavalin A-like superfamily)